MRIERVAQNQIKITLSDEELRDWEINVDRLARNPEETRELIWSLIRQADEETGFFTDGSQLMVEAMRKTDGFAMLITKLGEGGSSCSNDGPPVVRARLKREPRIRKRKATDTFLVYRFEGFEALTQACQCIENRFAGHSSLYKLNNAYYLLLDVVNECLAEDLCLLLSEYSERVTQTAFVRGRLYEYGRVLMGENAVGQIASFFDDAAPHET